MLAYVALGYGIAVVPELMKTTNVSDPDAFLTVRGTARSIGQTDAKDIHVAAAAGLRGASR